MERFFSYKCYEIGDAEVVEKVTVFKKYLLLKKFFFWKSSYSEEVPASKKYIFLIITYCGEKAPPKTVAVLKKYLPSRIS